jgi:hypothetical protein
MMCVVSYRIAVVHLAQRMVQSPRDAKVVCVFGYLRDENSVKAGRKVPCEKKNPKAGRPPDCKPSGSRMRELAVTNLEAEPYPQPESRHWTETRSES